MAIRSTKRFVLYASVLMGWLVGLLFACLVLTPTMAVAGPILAELVIAFLVASLGFLVPVVKMDKHMVPAISICWVLLAISAATLAQSPQTWALMLLFAAVPALHIWLGSLAALTDRRRQTFVLTWMGTAVFASALVGLNMILPTATRIIYALPLLPLAGLIFASPLAPVSVRKDGPVMDRQLLAFWALWLIVGLVMGHEANGPIQSPPVLSLLAFLTSTAVIAGFSLRPVLFQKVSPYVAIVLLLSDLLSNGNPVTRFLGSHLALFVATNLFIVSWTASRITAHQHSPFQLGWIASIAMGALGLGLVTGLLPWFKGHTSYLTFGAVILTVTVLPTIADGRSTVVSREPSTIETFLQAASLTPQERRIVELLMQGHNNQEILRELYVSINTLKTHLKNIYRKTHTKNRRELIECISRATSPERPTIMLQR